MKKTLYCLLIILFLTGCSKNNVNKNCNFLFNVAVNADINLNLPQYSNLNSLTFPVPIPGYGNKGLIVMKIGADSYVAYDASDPNHTPNTCSTLEIDGLNVVCGCEGNTFNLFTGQPLNNPNLQCGLKAYRVEKNGSRLFIY